VLDIAGDYVCRELEHAGVRGVGHRDLVCSGWS
jgi:hypothetical protein